MYRLAPYKKQEEGDRVDAQQRRQCDSSRNQSDEATS